MRNACIGWLIVWLSLANTAARADVTIASMSPEVVHTALAAIDAARKIAQAGRGSLLMAGSALSDDEATSPMVLAVLADPDLAQARPGSILLLAKTDCEPVERCLVARRFIERDSSGDVQTERYGSAEPLLLTHIQATLLGVVLYAVDLKTGEIRDMRSERRSERLSVEQAVAQEAGR
jgi:hypothetical protein